ncbi:MAG: Crp/Fnr family transcriptional regulator [Gammaproteobacteria bacterium]|nr:Crp/Fnr family transcriptional regulator [Gammaproteobacteria bacterium]
MFDLTKIELFSGLKESETDIIMNLVNPLSIEKDQLIIQEGEVSSNLYIVESGTLEVFTSNNSGSKFTLATLREGSYFGEYAFLDDASRTASVKTISECKLFEITKDDFTNVLQQYPQVYTTMVKNLVATIRHLNVQIRDLALKSIYPKLKQYLIDQSSSGFSNRKSSNTLCPEVIAKMIDCQIGSVSYLLSYLEDNNYIDIDDGNIYIYKTLPESII